MHAIKVNLLVILISVGLFISLGIAEMHSLFFLVGQIPTVILLQAVAYKAFDKNKYYNQVITIKTDKITYVRVIGTKGPIMTREEWNDFINGEPEIREKKDWVVMNTFTLKD